MIIKKSEKDERREKIIDVAFRLFVDKKIESVTMGEIAKEAGIGRALKDINIKKESRSKKIIYCLMKIKSVYGILFLQKVKEKKVKN